MSPVDSTLFALHCGGDLYAAQTCTSTPPIRHLIRPLAIFHACPAPTVPICLHLGGTMLCLSTNCMCSSSEYASVGYFQREGNETARSTRNSSLPKIVYRQTISPRGFAIYISYCWENDPQSCMYRWRMLSLWIRTTIVIHFECSGNIYFPTTCSRLYSHTARMCCA